MEKSRKPFVFSPALARKMFELRFQNETLFKEKKQPWQEFREILLANGFPKAMTVDSLRRKWSNAFDSYKIARKFGNKWWKYYKIFHKHYGKNDITDKFESWNDEWRINLVNAITEAKAMKLDEINFWRTVEHTLRNQDLPIDCCIQDIKPLWNYLKTVFQRKHRPLMNTTNIAIDWRPFVAILKYYKKYEKEYFENGGLVKRLKTDYPDPKVKIETISVDDEEEMPRSEFIWTKDTTETFIQIRLQNEPLFRQTAWAWNNLRTKMINEHDFPKNVSGQDLCKKWACVIRGYQKAQATNNMSWIYHKLLESYYADGNLTLNPLHGWDETWTKALITSRTDCEYIFSEKNQKDPWKNWREVEMALRLQGLPVTCSVVDLPFMWDHLYKTFMWKQKFTQKGILSHPWPYYDAMFKYQSVRARRQKQPANHSASVNNNCDGDDERWDDDEDDVKLFDLKQRMELEPKIEVVNVHSCRTCTSEEGCVNVFDTKDGAGVNLADKLIIVCGVKIEKSDSLPQLICLTCVRDLEQAFKFRERCREADLHHRNNHIKPNICNNIKVEIKPDEDILETKNVEDNLETKNNNLLSQDDFLDPTSDLDLDIGDIEIIKEEKNVKIKREPKIIVKKIGIKKKYARYNYTKVCEVCGKHTTNLKNHMDAHSSDKIHSCDICDKKFKYKSSLQLHKVGHDPKPRKTCEVCGKTFHILAQYRRHFVYHSNKREFACETCGKRFNTIDILKVHLRTHTDERPFSCSDCGKTFRTAGCVSRHKRIVHKTKKKMIQNVTDVNSPQQ